MRPPPKTKHQNATVPNDLSLELPWEEIVQAVQGLRFGVVQLVIQDGRVIQIDKTEKIRLV